MAVTYLGRGSNMGDRKANLIGAIEALESDTVRLISSSGIYETEPWGFDDQSMFMNMVISIETQLECRELLEKLLGIESAMGRVRSGAGYEARIIDMDILLYDSQIINEPGLIVPHPRLHERMFVLRPLAEIAPSLMHPVLGKSISELLAGCSDRSGVVSIVGE